MNAVVEMSATTMKLLMAVRGCQDAIPRRKSQRTSRLRQIHRRRFVHRQNPCDLEEA